MKGKALAAVLAMLALVWSSAVPASGFSYSLVDSIATALGSVSDSLKKSSKSSRGEERADLQGDYRIVAIDAAPERPGVLRLQLRAQTTPANVDEAFLYLPAQIAEQRALAVGGIVTAQPRPYGVEFLNGEPRQAFFLVLDDDWYRELQARAVL